MRGREREREWGGKEREIERIRGEKEESMSEEHKMSMPTCLNVIPCNL